MNNESFGVNAGLAAISHARDVSFLNREFQISIVKHDERVRATELKAALLHISSSDLCHLLSSTSRPRELDSSDPLVSNYLGSLLVGHEQGLEFSIVHACVSEKLLNGSCALRGRGRSFKKDRVAVDHWRDH